MAFDAELPPIHSLKAERLLALADRIEALPPELFDMTTFGREPDRRYSFLPRGRYCGCIAYHAACLALKREINNFDVFSIPDTAREWLQLNAKERYELFAPRFYITGSIAANVLREFAHTGQIKWGEKKIPGSISNFSNHLEWVRV